MARTKKQPGFEERLKQLEGIVHKLEEGNLPLEESLGLFEQGITLSRELQVVLEAASLRVSRLLENGRGQPFEGGEVSGSPGAAGAKSAADGNEATNRAKTGDGEKNGTLT